MTKTKEEQDQAEAEYRKKLAEENKAKFAKEREQLEKNRREQKESEERKKLQHKNMYAKKTYTTGSYEKKGRSGVTTPCKNCGSYCFGDCKN